MKRSMLLFAVFSLFLHVSIAQTLRNDIKYYDFAYLESGTDTSKFDFLKRFAYVAKSNEDVYTMFSVIRLNAKAMEANCFKFKSFSRDSLGRATLVLDVYSGDYPDMKKNFDSHDKNTVYVLGDDRFDNDSSLVKVDDDEIYLKSGSYFKITLKQGGAVKISKGGIFSSVETVRWGEGNLSQFLTTTGFGVKGIVPTDQGVGVLITVGNVYSIDYDFGRLLIDIYNQQN